MTNDWNQFAAENHLSVRDKAGRFLYRLGISDRHLADDIAQQFWLGIVAGDYALLRRFDESRASLATYLMVLVRNTAKVYLRSERRRRDRENAVRRSIAITDLQPFEIEELESQLTAKERAYFRQVMIENGDDSEYSKSNVWQLRHRIRRKLLAMAG